MKKRISQKEMDALVVSQAEDDSKWEEWSSVNPLQSISIRLSERAIASLKALAKLRKEKSYQNLLKRWIDDRLIYEQAILREVKQTLSY